MLPSGGPTVFINYGSLKKKNLYNTGICVYGACPPLETTHRQRGWVREKKIKAAYEIVIYCFKICTVLQNQEL